MVSCPDRCDEILLTPWMDMAIVIYSNMQK